MMSSDLAGSIGLSVTQINAAYWWSNEPDIWTSLIVWLVFRCHTQPWVCDCSRHGRSDCTRGQSTCRNWSGFANESHRRSIDAKWTLSYNSEETVLTVNGLLINVFPSTQSEAVFMEGAFAVEYALQFRVWFFTVVTHLAREGHYLFMIIKVSVFNIKLLFGLLILLILLAACWFL